MQLHQALLELQRLSEAEGEDYRRPRANETDADNDERDQHRRRKNLPSWMRDPQYAESQLAAQGDELKPVKK
jgi:hypothetical protein